MEENIFYEDDNKIDTNNNETKDNNNINIISTDKNDDNKDELVSSLPSWDLIPPYEEIRRIIK